MKLFRNKDRLKYEFLPSALEITETPPNPFALVVIWLVVALILSAVAWSYFGRIDIIATAQGRVIPDGNVKIVQSATTGIITNIKISDGDEVKKGDLLVELDPTVTQADVTSLKESLSSAKLERDVLKNTAAGMSSDDTIDQSDAPDSVKEDLRALANSNNSSYQVQRKFASLEVSQAQKQLSRAQSDVSEVETKLDKAISEQQSAQAAYDRSSATDKATLQTQLNRASATVDTLQQAIPTLQARVDQANTVLNQANSSLTNLDSSNSSTSLSRVIDLDKTIAQLESNLNKAQENVKEQSVYAPVDGTVMSLKVNTVGGVVTQGQQVVTIVPRGTPLTIEASLQNQDIGFVTVGQTVAIKVETYSFQRYGLLHGKVIAISPDSVQNDKTGAFTYSIKVSVDTSTTSRDKNIALRPGMTTTSEIKTGDRRIINFFLDPLISSTHDSLNVR